jgi:hypothetical protein
VAFQPGSLSTGQIAIASNVLTLQRAFSDDPQQAACRSGTTLQQDSRRERMAQLWAQAGPNTPAAGRAQQGQGPIFGRSYARGGGVQYIVVPANVGGVPQMVATTGTANSSVNRPSLVQLSGGRAAQQQRRLMIPKGES